MSVESIRPIRRLPSETINRIAAGEVVERPASAVKELLENALDAGAAQVDVTIDGGGVALIDIADNGAGMDRDGLSLAVERHATSKLAPDADGRWDLLNIATMGFRGEALPSIASVARLSLTSQTAASPDAWRLDVEAGAVQGGGPRPAQTLGGPGTRAVVRDLFHATPARLKFLKSERAETAAIVDVVKRLAMANPRVGVSLRVDGRLRFALSAATGSDEDARAARLGDVLGRDFTENALVIDQAREGVRLTGLAGLPTFNRGSNQHQYLFVNGRPVRDKLLVGAIRGAYQDHLARDRHPMAALSLELAPQRVDVNVHPAKTEVRFREAGLVRGLLVGALRHALARAGHRASTSVAGFALGAAQAHVAPPSAPRPGGWRQPHAPGHHAAGGASRYGGGLAEAAQALLERDDQPPLWAGESLSARLESPSTGEVAPVISGEPAPDYPLGVARAQLHETYIVAQTRDGIVIVDQHAAHERLVYERMKQDLKAKGVARQVLLTPEIVDLEPEAAERVAARAGQLADLGLVVEAFGPGAVAVREVPALLGDCDVHGLVRDLADDFAQFDAALSLIERLEEVCATMACHGCVRAGRRLQGAEMNALLREMEAVPHSGQCNHGRPTYVELKLKDIERLFGRR